VRKFVIVALVALALGSFVVGPASAVVPLNQIVVRDFDCAIDCESQDVTSISGYINCPAGQQYFFRVNLRQGGETKAVGRASGVCSGAPNQQWSTNRVDNPGTLDCTGPIVSSGKGTIGGNPVRIDPEQQYCDPQS
jgi:hypothetical protein